MKRWTRDKGIITGTVDPHKGANGIWNPALGGVDLRPLQPLIDLGDEHDEAGVRVRVSGRSALVPDLMVLATALQQPYPPAGCGTAA